MILSVNAELAVLIQFKSFKIGSIDHTWLIEFALGEIYETRSYRSLSRYALEVGKQKAS